MLRLTEPRPLLLPGKAEARAEVSAMDATDGDTGCLLGIDFGTSTIKTIVVERGSHRFLQAASLPVTPVQRGDTPQTHKECDVSEILTCLDSCVGQLGEPYLRRVCSIGVCGQMHGCVLWKSGASFLSSGRLQCPQESSSNLITWQDGRCTPEFLSSLPQIRQSIPVSSGYGCATLAWLQSFHPEQVTEFDRAGTIMDLLVCALCGREGDVLMSMQNAASWGYFDVAMGEWEKELLTSGDFPSHLLPPVAQAPCLAGYLKESWKGISVGVAVGVGMGDLQCSVYAAKPTFTDAVLNIGSASQLAVIKPSLPTKSTSDGIQDHASYPPSLMMVPYFNGDRLIVAAALGGGVVVATFVSMLQGWLKALGVTADACPEAKIYQTIIEAAGEKLDTPLVISPVLWGERHAPDARGSVASITPDCLTLGDISSAMFRGIIQNLMDMMHRKVFEELNIKQILGSGHALQRNTALRAHVERVMRLPLVIREGADAPLGAAIAVEDI